MTKAEQIKRYGIATYEKRLKQSRERNRENRIAVRAKRKIYLANLSEERKLKMREYHKERSALLREKDREAYNAYQKAYYHKNKDKIRARVKKRRKEIRDGNKKNN